MSSDPGPVWLLASRLLGRPVPVDEPYPHVCGEQVGTEFDRVTPILMMPNGCAGCAERGHQWSGKRRRY